MHSFIILGMKAYMLKCTEASVHDQKDSSWGGGGMTRYRMSVEFDILANSSPIFKLPEGMAHGTWKEFFG